MAAILDGYDLAEFWQELGADERRSYVRDHVEMFLDYVARKRDEAALFAAPRSETPDVPDVPDGKPVPLPPMPPGAKHLQRVYAAMLDHGGYIGMKEMKERTGTPDNSIQSSVRWLLERGVIEKGPRLERRAGLGDRVYKYQSFIICRQ